MVGIQGGLRRSAHPAVGKRTPSRNDDFFEEDQLRKLREYIAPLRRNRRIRTLVSTALTLWLVFGVDLGPTAAGWVSGQGWVVRLLVVAAAFEVLESLPTLPFSYWAQLVYEKRAGHSTMTPAVWVKDQFLELALGLVIGALMLVPVYAAIHAVGDWWWAVGGAVMIVIQVALAFVAPIWILPRFNKFTPLEPGPIRSRIEELAELSGVQIEGVYLMDASKRTTRANAGVTGFGKTKRVIVNDTICEYPIEELSQVIAHELGHYRLGHVVKSFPLSCLQLPISLLFVQLVGGNERVLSWAGVGDLGDPASFGLLTLLFGTCYTVTSLPAKWLSRKHEREADLEALELLADPTSFVAVWPHMVLTDKANLEPTPWEKVQATHPEIAERMQFGLSWAEMNSVPVTRPARQSIPEPATAGSDTTSEARAQV